MGKRWRAGPAGKGKCMGEQGTLKVRVYTSEAQIPLEGATVVVTAPGRGAKERLISVQVTDRNGMVKPVFLETPGTEASEMPALGGRGEPYALCSVWAEHPGYALLKVEGVQVFPGVETLQEMELIPLGMDESSLENRDVRPGSLQDL